MAKTLFDKIWDAHVVDRHHDGTALLYIDLHLIHEVTSPQAFEGLRLPAARCAAPDATLAVVDHNIRPPTARNGIGDGEPRIQVETLERNVASSASPTRRRRLRQGIVHIIGPELGFTLPGMTIVCGDSHTSTHGAIGALAFGIGTSEVEHVLATQTLMQKPPRTCASASTATCRSASPPRTSILAIIGKIGTAGGTGHVIEYAGDAIRALVMAGRMTVCNMSIEGGARAGMIAPDETTFDYVRPAAWRPRAGPASRRSRWWRTLPTDDGARFDREVVLDAADIAPQVTWGTSPEDVLPITGAVPDPAALADERAPRPAPALAGLHGPRARHADQRICGGPGLHRLLHQRRIEDIRAAAAIARGRKVADGVRAMVVPGSGLVKKQAEEEGSTASSATPASNGARPAARCASA